MATVGDPVGQGLVASLAKPGGNLTGNGILSEVVITKRVELLMSSCPRLGGSPSFRIGRTP